MVPTGPLRRALAAGNSVAQQWANLDPQGPDPRGPALTLDGIYAAGQDGITAPARLLLLPLCDGGYGTNFSVRLYGWRRLALPVTQDPEATSQVWLPLLLAELACTASNRGGPPPDNVGVSRRLLLDSERLCDTISLTQGALGVTGFISSTGPGTDLIAFALCELLGSQLFSFDFQGGDTGNIVGMNTLWGLA